eukprot:4496013-Prymnesium_polylepis.1
MGAPTFLVEALPLHATVHPRGVCGTRRSPQAPRCCVASRAILAATLHGARCVVLAGPRTHGCDPLCSGADRRGHGGAHPTGATAAWRARALAPPPHACNCGM